MKHYLLAICVSLTLSAMQATNPLTWQHRYRHYYPQLNSGNNMIYEKKDLDPRSAYNGESSLRDLDIGVGIGVKDNDEDINAITPEDLQRYAQGTVQQESPSSKEVNIGLYTPQAYPRMTTANYYNPMQSRHNPYDAPFASLPYPYSNDVEYQSAYPQRAITYQQVPPLDQILKGSAAPRPYDQPFDGYGRFRTGNYERNPVKQIIVNEEGVPVMVAEPYGDRRVGSFKLLNDQGYHVTMKVPPSPPGVADGVLVMEMKATLYRPIN